MIDCASVSDSMVNTHQSRGRVQEQALMRACEWGDEENMEYALAKNPDVNSVSGQEVNSHLGLCPYTLGLLQSCMPE